MVSVSAPALAVVSAVVPAPATALTPASGSDLASVSAPAAASGLGAYQQGMEVGEAMGGGRRLDDGHKTAIMRLRAPHDDRGSTARTKDNGVGATVDFYRVGNRSCDQGSLGSLMGATERPGGLQGAARAPRGETPETGR